MDENSTSAHKTCLICDEQDASLHYGALSCHGCKNFFRRSVKSNISFECPRANNCPITSEERRFSCRACRLQKCLAVGMDPSKICPDRDVLKRKYNQTTQFGKSAKIRVPPGDKFYMQELPVEMRTIVMELRNTIAKVMGGDTTRNASEIYPLNSIRDIREIVERPERLKGARSKICYEPYYMAYSERELLIAVDRRVLAATDWVGAMADRLGGLGADDRMALVRACFVPLTIFIGTARTALVTEREDLYCLCNSVYVGTGSTFKNAYHLDNNLLECMLGRLVKPFRRMRMSEEELVCMTAIVVVNPMAPGLSSTGADKCFEFRNRILSTLQYISATSSPESNPTVRFGNFLLQLPIITALAEKMHDNLRFAQMLRLLSDFPVLSSLIELVPVFPFSTVAEQRLFAKDQRSKTKKCSRNMTNKSTQTEAETSSLNTIITNPSVSTSTQHTVDYFCNVECLNEFSTNNPFDTPRNDIFASEYVHFAVLPSMFD